MATTQVSQLYAHNLPTQNKPESRALYLFANHSERESCKQATNGRGQKSLANMIPLLSAYDTSKKEEEEEEEVREWDNKTRDVGRCPKMRRSLLWHGSGTRL